ncbi:MAG: HypC/HybG/HupF family hydrogenase formation chaperone [Promethearchaeota archaeon]
MCIAVPVKILQIKGDGITATVDYGGLKKTASIILVKDKVQVGDYIIVHAGAAIQKVDEEDALERIEIFKEMMDE